MLDLPRSPGSPRVGPIQDGHFLPASIAEIFSRGEQSDVPLLLGFTRDESFGGLGQAEGLANYRAKAALRFGARAPEFLSLYPASNDAEAKAQARHADRDGTMALGMREWASQQFVHGSAPVFSYEFAQAHRYPDGVIIYEHDVENAGAYHTSEVPFWLGTLESFNVYRPTRAWEEADRALSHAMRKFLVTFARRGAPQASGMEWARFEAGDPQLQMLSSDPTVMPSPDEARFAFFRGRQAQD